MVALAFFIVSAVHFYVHQTSIIWNN